MNHQKEYDCVIVGSGLFGATFARLATDAGQRCLVLEKRSKPGGNIRCEEIQGITVHKYGPHIFHTSNEKIWNFVNSFVEFRNFINSPLASFKGKIFNLPFNMNTFHQLWGVTTPGEAREIISAACADQIRLLEQAGISEPRNLEEKALTLVGREIYETLIKGYTEKQWGRQCNALPPEIISRIPLRFVYDNNYFNDRFQGIPAGGYNRLVSGLLDGIETVTDVDFLEQPSFWRDKCETLVYTGQIDEYFNFRFGRLEYRSVRWENEVLETPDFQGNAVINYTDTEHPYTRIIEHKHFAMRGERLYANPYTVISREYSEELQPRLEPFYPINDVSNSHLMRRYEELASLEPDTIFGGRLAEYRYYDMDDVIERAFETFESYRQSKGLEHVHHHCKK